MKVSKRAKFPPGAIKACALALAALLGGCAVSPSPITREQRATQVRADRVAMYRDQTPLAGPLKLEDAMARAVQYNLENRVKLMEQALALGQLDLARYDMLPRLTAAAGYSTRNNDLVTDSVDVDSGRTVLSNTTSQQRTHHTFDLSLTWNVLDFGVSWYQANQQADRALVARERQRKTLHALMQQVRQAYWLAVGAQALEGRVEPLLEQVNRALADAQRVEAEKLRPPLETLNYRKAMLDIVRQLEAIRDELTQSKPRLAALMNLAPGTQFSLLVPARLAVPELPLGLAEMEERALTERPELYEADLNERISVAEAKKAVLRMLPGIEISFGPHYDSNAFLHNNNWVDAGLRVSWNLFNLLSGPKQKELADAQVELARTQRLALSMAVLTQVHVSWREYAGRKRQYDLSQKLWEIDDRIFEHTRIGAQNDAQSRLNEIRSGVSALMSDYRRYQNYANLQAAYGQVIASLGEDPVAPAGLAAGPEPDKLAAATAPQ
ncbi:MAG: TolC family protein [Rhodocyclaceae bacterium]|nr:TolC family protein [Rhodocyclaceae bacterium]